jgi:hypothetical protein
MKTGQIELKTKVMSENEDVEGKRMDEWDGEKIAEGRESGREGRKGMNNPKEEMEGYVDAPPSFSTTHPNPNKINTSSPSPESNSSTSNTNSVLNSSIPEHNSSKTNSTSPQMNSSSPDIYKKTNPTDIILGLDEERIMTPSGNIVPRKNIKDTKKHRINQKQRDFIDKIVLEFMSPPDAYKAVYKSTNKVTNKTNAYRLLKRPDIQEYMNKTASESKTLAQMPKHQIILKLKAFLEKCEADGDKKYFMEAINTLNRMFGYNDTSGKVNTTNINQTISFGDFNPLSFDVPPFKEIGEQDNNENIENDNDF